MYVRCLLGAGAREGLPRGGHSHRHPDPPPRGPRGRPRVPHRRGRNRRCGALYCPLIPFHCGALRSPPAAATLCHPVQAPSRHAFAVCAVCTTLSLVREGLAPASSIKWHDFSGSQNHPGGGDSVCKARIQSGAHQGSTPLLLPATQAAAENIRICARTRVFGGSRWPKSCHFYEYRRDIADNRWHSLRNRPRLCEAKGL